MAISPSSFWPVECQFHPISDLARERSTFFCTAFLTFLPAIRDAFPVLSSDLRNFPISAMFFSPITISLGSSIVCERMGS